MLSEHRRKLPPASLPCIVPGMSKAFTRESDEEPVRPRPRAVSALPPGTKNYVTADGNRKLREELDRCLAVGHPRPAHVEQRLAYLQQSLLTAEVVPVPPSPWNTVRFGATVTVRERNGQETRYRLVGVDETDVDRDWISWLSPIARALLNARVGSWVTFKFPAGEKELEIVGITYE
jgi:transcription elongation factor GreB